MCGRYTLVATPEEVAGEFGLVEPPPISARSNISPTEGCLVVYLDHGIPRGEMMRWGFLSKAQPGKPLINARSETAHEKRSFADAFAHRRCLIPASGFYEWRLEGARKQPYCFEKAGGGLLAFAGLWNIFSEPGVDRFPAFTILTTGANTMMSAYHDRMPVIVRREDYARWMDPQAPVDSLRTMVAGVPEGALTAAACSSPGGVRRDVPQPSRTKPDQNLLFDLESPES